MDLGLTGKVALVTGASKGIGKAIAEEFAKEGAHLSICARGQADLATAAEELRRYGVAVIATPADVTKPDDIQRVIDVTIKQCGRIDILVNNAGSAWLGHSIDTPDAQWQYAWDVNLQSAVVHARGCPRDAPARRRAYYQRVYVRCPHGVGLRHGGLQRDQSRAALVLALHGHGVGS